MPNNSNNKYRNNDKTLKYTPERSKRGTTSGKTRKAPTVRQKNGVNSNIKKNSRKNKFSARHPKFMVFLKIWRMIMLPMPKLMISKIVYQEKKILRG